MSYSSVNPATRAVLKTFAEHTDQEMIDALATADKAFISWGARLIEERVKTIFRTARLLFECKSESAKLATLEMGKRIAENRCEVDLSAAILQYFADHAAKFLVLTGLTPDNPAYKQEFFGPVALVFPTKNEAEAIAIASDSPVGLGGSVHSINIERAKRVETGMVFTNYPDVSWPNLPFGGVKRSGYGKELSKDKTDMLRQLWTMFQGLTGIATDQLALSLQEIPPTNAMEMGQIMQAVGHE